MLNLVMIIWIQLQVIVFVTNFYYTINLMMVPVCLVM
jgi:hypothetical protein